MRKTNCKGMTGMMPLYVAGDLVGEPEREAAAHLADCQACRQLAAEFSESRSLLTQAFTPPEFGAEFYTRIRHAVLGKITGEGITSTTPLFGQWGRRWLYAGALAAVVIATVTLLLFRGISREPSRELAVAPPAGQAMPDQRKEANSGLSRELSEPPLKPVRATEQTPRPHRQFVLADSRQRNSQIEAARKLVAQATARAATNSRKQIAPAVRSTVAPASLESITLSGRPSSPSRIAAASEISRIEIQTADPNIRIIWFASRDSQKPEEINHDQDPENGDRN